MPRTWPTSRRISPRRPIAGAGAKSDFLPNVAKTSVTFPDDYKSTFTRYHAINYPAATKRAATSTPIPAALQAAREGKSLPDGSVLLFETWSAKLDADKASR